MHQNESRLDKKLLATTLIGNTLEFYDYVLYAAYATIISPLFLPGFNVATIVYLGLLARPIGGLVFGHIGDKWGRRYALSLTMYLMAIPSLILVLLPPYADIGIFSVIFIIVARTLQAFCAAGEFNGAAIMSLEIKNRGYINGLINASCGLGGILAYSVSWTLGNTYWRYAFGIGLCIALIGYYIRKKVFNIALAQQEFVPLSQIFKTHKKEMLLTAILGGKCVTLILFTYVHIPLMIGKPHLAIYCMILLIMADLFFGYISDYVKNKTWFFIVSSFLVLLVLWPTILAIKAGWHLLGLTIFTLIAGMHDGPQHLYFVSLFPKTMRCRGISFSYAMGGAILGSLLPMFLELFYKESAILALLIVSFISFIVFTSKLITEKKEVFL